tara:strand:+ start:379 stop:537 length:159 start_codon:yes stop_codon:yes gene_type:complete
VTVVSAYGFADAMLVVGEENGTQKDLCIYQLIFYLKIKMNYPVHCIFHFHLL